jgi:hypothetical protein
MKTTADNARRPIWSIRGLPDRLVLRLSAVSFATGIAQADLVESALTPYLDQLERDRGIASVVRNLVAVRAAGGRRRNAPQPKKEG